MEIPRFVRDEQTFSCPLTNMLHFVRQHARLKRAHVFAHVTGAARPLCVAVVNPRGLWITDSVKNHKSIGSKLIHRPLASRRQDNHERIGGAIQGIHKELQQTF
jgi:hypothetical protein